MVPPSFPSTIRQLVGSKSGSHWLGLGAARLVSHTRLVGESISEYTNGTALPRLSQQDIKQKPPSPLDDRQAVFCVAKAVSELRGGMSLREDIRHADKDFSWTQRSQTALHELVHVLEMCFRCNGHL